MARAALPHGVVAASDARRRYARRWPELPRDEITRALIASSGLELLPPWVDLRRGRAVDVGAHVGDWTAAVLAIAPSVSVAAIEADPVLAARVRERFAANPNVAVHAVAAGAASDTAKLHLTHDRHLSSLRKPSEAIVDLYDATDWWTIDDTIEVPLRPLDELLAPLGDISVLKVDVQGAEREVLAGARDTVARAGAILIEVNYSTYYTGEASFGEIHELLMRAGLVLTGLGAAGALADGRLAWTDACYARPHRASATP